jgi:hypothetical protein
VFGKIKFEIGRNAIGVTQVEGFFFIMNFPSAMEIDYIMNQSIFHIEILIHLLYVP